MFNEVINKTEANNKVMNYCFFKKYPVLKWFH